MLIRNIDKATGPRKAGSIAYWIISYITATALACALVLLADHIGLSLTIFMIVAGIIILFGLSDFTVLARVVIIVFPLIQTLIFPHTNFNITGPKALASLAFLTLASVFCACVLRPGCIRLPRPPWAFYAFVFVIIVGALIGIPSLKQIPNYFLALSVVQSISVGPYLIVWLVTPCLILLTCFICSLLAANSRDPHAFILPAFAPALIFSCVVIAHASLQNVSLNELAGQEARGYLSSLGLHANEIGLMMNMAFALSLFTLNSPSCKSYRALVAITSAVSLFAVLLTFSRAAYFGMFISFLYLAFLKKTWFSFALLAIITLSVICAAPETMLERSQQGISNGDIASLSTGRFDGIWLPLLPELTTRPFFGNGHGSILWSEAARQQQILPVGHPHSAYLSALADVGLIGTAVFAVFYFEIWRTFRKLVRVLNPGLLHGFFQGASVCVLIMFIQGLTDDSFVPSYTHAYLWLSYGVALGFKTRLNVT